MDRTGQATHSRRRGRWVVRLVVLTALFVTAIAVEGCGTTSSSGTWAMSSMPVAAAPTMGGGAAATPAPDMAAADAARAFADAAWASRPSFVSTTAETEEAYSYAFHNPQIVQWMPCYCGCARMDHRSNLDCYLKRGIAGQGAQFEEHASYCDVCVRITLETKQLVSQGKSLREVRQAVDHDFGGQVDGTPTQLPPA